MFFNDPTKQIDSLASLIDAVHTEGVLPFFSNRIPGFSIKEHVAPAAWFGEAEGIWEWKGPAIRSGGIAYGKFFGHKAAFVSLPWFCHLANLRREGLDAEERYLEGDMPYGDRQLYLLLEKNAPVLSKELKRLGDYRKGGNRGFDPAVGRLQQRCYVTIHDFVYQRDRWGQPYGWGVAQYTTPELCFGPAFADRVYACDPAQSKQALLEHLGARLPGTPAEALERFLK